MRIAGENPHEAENQLFDREDLASDIELILKGGPHAPDVLARLFITFSRAIESGLRGVDLTRRALLIAVEAIYLYSPAHDAALRLYFLSLQGELRVEDEPINLIHEAISRSSARFQPNNAGRNTRRS